MDIFLGDKKFHLDYGSVFSEKVSQLKKKTEIIVNIDHYVYDNMVKPDTVLVILKSIKEIPETIYVSKSIYYWWVFDGCKLIDINVYQDKKFYDYQGRNIEKWNCELKFCQISSSTSKFNTDLSELTNLTRFCILDSKIG